MHRPTSALLFASLTSLASLLAACGDDGGGSAIDARIVGQDAPVECKATAAYGTATLADQYAGRDLDTNPEAAYVNGSMNTDFDDLTVELYKGYGVFTDTEIVPTTVQLTGEEAAYETCGACVLIYANWDRDLGEAEMVYLAIGGTLTITQVSPNLQGTLLNASFVHVDIDTDGVSTPSPDQCASTIEQASFDAVVMTDPPMFAPATRHRPHHRRRR